MIRRMLVLAAALFVAAPTLLSAQNLAIAVRGGSIGLGAEAALGLGDRLSVRGGLGLLPFEPSASSFWDPGEDVDVKLTFPENWYNIGADLHLTNSFRIGGGLLFKPDDPTVAASLTGTASIDIGGTTYTASDVASVTGTIDSKDQAPYVLVGFGNPKGRGLGLYLDVGAAFVGEPEVRLSATGNPTIVNSAQFQARLSEEEQKIEDDAGKYLKLWPIINLGLRFGF